LLKTYAAIMAGGAAGTALRFWLSTLLTNRFGEGFPLGTLAVNVIGSFAISFFAELATTDGRLPVSYLARQVVIIGVLGGFTTFSSFSYQTLALFEAGQSGRALANVGLSVLLCLGAVYLGRLSARALH
jgi:CrcB protein